VYIYRVERFVIMGIEELSIKDLLLLEKLEGYNKLIEIGKTNFPDFYNELFCDYSSNEDIESLKRAIFIQWYAVSEPFFNTGILELDQSYQVANLFKVKNLLESNDIDLEFVAMLTHYYAISDFHLDMVFDMQELLVQFNSNKKLINGTRERGIMGDYWEKVLKNRNINMFDFEKFIRE